MSNQITTAMVNQYSSNVFHLSQQKAARLKAFVRSESQKAEAAFYDRIGSVEPQKKVGRHSQTTYQDTPHSRRKVTLNDYFYSDLVDKEDKIRIIHNPESEYVKAGAMAMGRGMDDEIIIAALGNAYGGKTGNISVPLPNSQKIASIDGTSTTGAKLTVQTLRLIRKKFWQNEAGDEQIYMAVGAQQLDDLLGETAVTSADFNTVRALAKGDVDSFMGITFIRTERLPVLNSSFAYNSTTGAIGGSQTFATGARRCFAWMRDGLLCAIGQDVKTNIDRMPEFHQAHQVYVSMTIGATRLEEEKVVEVLCKES